MKPTPSADFYELGEGRYCLKAAAFSLDVDRLRRERHELVGELVVRAFTPDVEAGAVLSCSDFNLSSQRARQERAKFLADRAKVPDFDFYGLVEEFCQRVVEAERKGQPAVMLRELPRPEVEAEYVVEGLSLLRQHATILFGDGGAAKSYLALWLLGELALRGVRVLFCDWELSADEHRIRLERLFGDDMPPVEYARCERPLVHEADRLRRLCRVSGTEFIVIDSVAVASDGPPEAAEVCTAYFRALRSIGVGSLSIAHITKGEQGDQKPFGSAFWANLARATWFAKPAATDGPRVTVGLFNRKANLTALRPACGFELDFGEGRTAVRAVSVAEHADLADNLPLWQRMKDAVRQRPMTAASLAEELGAKVETLERTARRYNRLFTKVSSADGISRIALVDRRTA